VPGSQAAKSAPVYTELYVADIAEGVCGALN